MTDLLDETPDSAPGEELDPGLVEAMRSRVVRRKSRAPKNPVAGPGRPAGHPKTGGKTAGTPNLWTPEFRSWLEAKAKPFDLLARVCAGEEIQDGDETRRPRLQERLRAAELISRKLIPDLAASDIKKSVEVKQVVAAGYGGLSHELEVARRVAFLLSSGLMTQQNEAAVPDVVDVVPSEDEGGPSAPQAGGEELAPSSPEPSAPQGVSAPPAHQAPEPAELDDGWPVT